jgi:predicted nucleotidyltransferase
MRNEEEVGKVLGKVEVIVFGSILDKQLPRDINVLIVSKCEVKDKGEILGKIHRRLGITNPFEIHHKR